MLRIFLIASFVLFYGCGRQEKPAPNHSDRPPRARLARHPTAADTRPVIACFGDSLTAGFGLDPGQSFPDLLQQDLDRAD